MRFHKDLIGQRYVPGAIWLILGLLVIFFLGKFQLLDMIRKNSWKPVRAELAETRLLKPVKPGRKPQNSFRWKYKEKGRVYYGEEILPAGSSPEFSAGRPIRILVNPENPSESTLFCWNNLAASAKVLRVIFLLFGAGIAGLGIYTGTRPPRKTAILVYDLRKEARSLFHYAAFPLGCLLLFGILALLTRFLDSRLVVLVYLSILLFPLLTLRFLRMKTPPLFQVSCPNPDCFSLKFVRMRGKTLAENKCPACGTPLGIPPRSPEKKWKRPEIPDPRFFPRADSFPEVLLLGWILIMIPFIFFFYPPEILKTAAARNSAMVLLVGWSVSGLLLMPFFMELSRRWKLRKGKALICPVCGACLCERESIEILRNTGHCPACGADVVEPE